MSPPSSVLVSSSLLALQRPTSNLLFLLGGVTGSGSMTMLGRVSRLGSCIALHFTVGREGSGTEKV